MKRPPGHITIRWCSECGRTDRFVPFVGSSHKTFGVTCPGQPKVVLYKFVAQS